MREGWGDWVAGSILGIWAVSIPFALYEAGSKSVPPLPWIYFAIYGFLAVVVAVVSTVLLRRGWIALHSAPPIE